VPERAKDSGLTPTPPKHRLASIEICAGGGGQAIGIEQAGFEHLALVEIDTFAVATLEHNRPKWRVYEKDVNLFIKEHGGEFVGKVDLVAGGVPCPPFSVAGRQLGHEDERDLFPAALRLVRKVKPKAVMLENVRGLLDPRFDQYRARLDEQFEKAGYHNSWRLLNASDFGVPQLRPRVVCVALRKSLFKHFEWPVPSTPNGSAMTVGKTLEEIMASGGWAGAKAWAERANKVAPTLVGGSMKHGGPDLGPTRARKAWAELGVDGLGLANDVPSKDFSGIPKITVGMAGLIQGFPADWEFVGGKTASYRQVGNAFPPPVARAVAEQIRKALEA
jgi:DNA (cytosine-5)-methyltransferase 1